VGLSGALFTVQAQMALR